jgi:tetratricopeptide (TPR) repeat protein
MFNKDVNKLSPDFLTAVLKSKSLNRPFIPVVLIALLGLLAYSNSFDVPFQFDDIPNIVKNPVIKDLKYFIHPSKAKEFEGSAQSRVLAGRYVGYLSFALNYSAHGLNVKVYHVTNLLIHIINGLLFYYLVMLTFKTPRLSGSSLRNNSRHIALFASLLFVSHPVQTQAVTFIVQRLASMAAMFYLFTLVLYIRSRLSTGMKVRCLLYGLSLVSAILGMNTKQTVFTLPVAVALYEFLFFTGGAKKRSLYLIPLFLTMLIVPLNLAGADKSLGELMGDMEIKTAIRDISRSDYLLTEFRVIVTYLRLLVLPVGQNLYYDYPIYDSFFEIPVFLSFLSLLSLFGFGVYLLYRSRISDHALRFTAFGIFWFFISLSVESSVIPLHVIYEHRVYLPSFGFFTAVITSAFVLARKPKSLKVKKAAICVFMLVLLTLSYATYARNSIWRSAIDLWEDTVSKSPNNARVHNNLGKAYGSENLMDKALEQFQIALSINPDFVNAHYNLGIAYKKKGLNDKAAEHLRAALNLRPDYAKAHIELGIVYWAKGLTDKAVKHFQNALKLKPYSAKAHYNLGLIYLEKGLTDMARRELETALHINPEYDKARRFLDYISNMR